MTASLLAGLTRLATGAQSRWINCSRQPGQRIYFANHTSHLDLVVLWAALPAEIRKSTRPVAAREYWLKGRLRAYLATSLFDAVLIPRPDGPLGGRCAA